MKSRIITYVLASLCLIGTVSCGEKPETEPVNDSATTAVTEEVTTEEATEEATEETTEAESDSAADSELPALSDEIPAEAVTKVTISESINDAEPKPVRIEYRDEHDNALLIFYCNDDGETKINRNIRYEYNDNGDHTYKYELAESYLNESYSEYDEKNRWISEKCYTNGLLSWEAEYEYDEYDNLILDKTTYYEDETGEIISISTVDRSDCDYDDQGHMLTVREKSGDVLKKTYNYTYDSDGKILTEKQTNEKYDSDLAEYKFTENKYEYGLYSDIPTLMEKSYLQEDGTLLRIDTTEREFDSSGKLLLVRHCYTDTDKTNMITYDYEEIK